VSCPSHPPSLDNSNYAWWRVQIMQLLIMQLSQPSCHFIPLWSKYFPQHSVL
jgi:putative component of membrane protein insertase Oxa1/YidC/SpoIIIJ protein YidD